MRKLLLTFCFLLVALSMVAVPSERVRQRLVLEDGTALFATLMGNEVVSFYLTDDGFVVEETDTGYRATGLRLEEYGAARPDRVRGMQRRTASREHAPLRSCGQQRIPVVLVQFSDVAFSVREDTAALTDYYRKYCNGTLDGQLYTGHGSRGSVRDYFVQQSDSLFLPEFTVIGPVTMDQPLSYYGKNSGGVKDIHFDELCDGAIRKAVQMHDDWTLFDNDHDGGVDLVFILYAGVGENCGGGASALWPKDHVDSLRIDGLSIESVASTCELRPAQKDAYGQVLSTKGDGIGVFVHEFCHSLGLPDFYDTVGYSFGMDLWSVMDYGEYANNGFNPGGLTAYERDFLGWQPLVTLEGPCTLRIPCFAEGGVGYKVVNDLNPNEYYVLENRQPMGWDDKVGTFGHGLQVTHVDYDATKWVQNQVNADSHHQCMTIIAANNLYKGSSTASTATEYRKTLSGNLYPGDTFNHDLDSTTVPANKVYVGRYMRKPIHAITEEADGTILLKYCPRGRLSEPINLSAREVQVGGFTLDWQEVDSAQCYTVRLLKDDVLLQECDSVTSTAMAFIGLEPEGGYRAEVCAMSDRYLNSGFASLFVTTLADNVEAPSTHRELVSIYTMDGRCVAQCREEDLHRLSLPSGTYVVHTQQGLPRKIWNE